MSDDPHRDMPFSAATNLLRRVAPSRRIELCSNGCVHLLFSMVCFFHLLVCRWHTLVWSLRAHCAHCVGTIRLYPNTRARKMYFTFGNSQVRRAALPRRAAPRRAAPRRAAPRRAAPHRMTPVMSAASVCATVAAAAAARRSFDGEQHERVSLERCLAHAVFTFATVLSVLPVGNGGLELAHPRRRALDCRCVRQFSAPSLSVGEYTESSRLSLALAL